jgi:hypothetical protein
MGHDTITFPQGPLPANYNTENRSHVLLGVGVTFIVLEIIAFALRVTARRINHVPFGWDDSLMIPALILNLAVAVMALGKLRCSSLLIFLSLVLTYTQYPFLWLGLGVTLFPS